MKRAIHLMLLFARVSVQNFAAYRFDFFMRLFMSFVQLGAELVIVYTIFHNTQSLAGWRWQHMVVLVGVYRIIAGGIRIYIVPNMRAVLEDIREGTLDFVLLKPVNSQLLVSIREFVFWRFTDILLGGAAAAYGAARLSAHVTWTQVATFAFMIVAAFTIIYALWLALATLGFWFIRVQNIEMVFWNVFEAGRYPVMIYPPWVQWSLTFLVPLAFITTFPAGMLTGAATTGVPPHTPLLAGVMAVVALIASHKFWQFGLKRYSGASA
ncbi:MAG: ABC-2 family transporter protein [Phycisphaerales bacterium]|nr:ABC-2 family transporter protein [Phycisphaerales bacterium]